MITECVSHERVAVYMYAEARILLSVRTATVFTIPDSLSEHFNSQDWNVEV